jgi:MFS family permease
LQRATDKRWLVLGITSVGVFMSSLDMFIVNIAFPEIAGDFAGSTFGELSWILNAYAIVFSYQPAGSPTALVASASSSPA